jgi:hypothetical protein
MWMRLLFWKRKANRIYTACPEIRHLIDQDARNTVMNAARFSLTAPLILPVGLFCSLAYLMEIAGARLFDAMQPVARWTWRETDAVREAHEILSPNEIKKRLGEATIKTKQ